MAVWRVLLRLSAALHDFGEVQAIDSTSYAYPLIQPELRETRRRHVRLGQNHPTGPLSERAIPTFTAR